MAVQLKLEEKHYPYWGKGRQEVVKSIEFYAKGIDRSAAIFEDSVSEDSIGVLEKNRSLGGIFSTRLSNKNPGSFDKPYDRELELYFDNKSMSDLWVAVIWGNSE